ncbi:4Fe-4S binding protein [Candidatus Bathyarchaeota archaeon]|nr:4Fe-4S binding protein [Candidatus Bathyarchaeota archaeon]
MSKKMSYKDIPIGLSVTARGQNHTGSWSIFRPGVNQDKCTKCGLCVIYCPEAAIEMTDKGTVVDYDYCKGCGICGNECPAGAITMERGEA